MNALCRRTNTILVKLCTTHDCRDIPPEVRERLEQITTVRETQAAHKEAFSRVDAAISHVADRIRTLETADRQQVAHLIEQQTQLIKVTMHQVSKIIGQMSQYCQVIKSCNMVLERHILL